MKQFIKIGCTVMALALMTGCAVQHDKLAAQKDHQTREGYMEDPSNTKAIENGFKRDPRGSMSARTRPSKTQY